MAIEKVININVQGNADEAVGSLRSQLRTAQQEVAALSDKFGATSQAAIDAAKRAGELKDKIGDAKALTDAFNPDAKFKALSSSLAGVAGGFAAVQGGMALFGAESKDVEKTLLKVQAAMALSAGLQQIGEARDSFKQLGAVIKSLNVVQAANNFIQTGSITLKKEDVVATTAQATATVVATTATSAATAGMKLLRLAIIGTGIGALVVGLVSLYQNFDKVKETVLNFIPGLKSVGTFFGNLVDTVTDFVGATSDASRELDRITAQAEKSAQSSQRFLDTQGYKYDEFTKKKIQANLDYAANVKKTNDDEKLSEKQKLADIKAFREKANFEIAQADKDRQDANDKKKKDAADKAEREAKKNQLTDAEIKEKLKKSNEEYNAQIDQSQTDFDVSSLEKLDATNQAKLDKDAKFKEDQLAADQQFSLEVAQAHYDSADARAEREEEDNKRKIQKYRDTVDAVGSIAKSGEELLGAVQSLGLARGKSGQAAMKALALVQIGADSAIAFSKMMQGTESSAAGAAVLAGPAAPATYMATKIAFYASGSATILANLARAKALLSSGGNASGGGASGGGAGGAVMASAAPAAPSFNVVGSSGVNQLAGVMSGKENTPVKAFVVPSDVTSGQSLDRNIIRNASLG